MRFKTSLLHIVIISGLWLLLMNGCKKEKKESPPPETGTVTDAEGTVYNTVKIGTQWWMAEDLKATKYTDGSPISEIKREDTAAWAQTKTGAYCVFSGYLYNWYAVNNPKIAPEGWHVPSDEDWKELEKHLGMNTSETEKTGWRGTNEGNKLKIEAPKDWFYPPDDSRYTVWGSNESGFKALAHACRMPDGREGNPGASKTGFWWTSSDDTIIKNQAWYRYLDYKNANVFRYYGPKTYGFSVRLVSNP